MGKGRRVPDSRKHGQRAMSVAWLAPSHRGWFRLPVAAIARSILSGKYETIAQAVNLL
ncbi:hypothetical protein ACFS3C_25250 [Azotobacter vinelandii]|uniref:DUF2877 domain-containing protein n=1 Tax=Azotobacter TaxID=352 RepID=UPI000A60AC5A|nr:DUF2877 domain-containing protein [Azotobacter vinelandii]WKN21814.1 hypothetical protein AVAEIV_004931 [Azotobacter vinelandii]